MARFSISGYDNDGKCKICGSHASEYHHEGCELGAVYAERKEMRLVIEQFLKLLGVETITSAFAKIAAEQSVHPTLPCTCWKDEYNVVHIDPACRRHPQIRASG